MCDKVRFGGQIVAGDFVFELSGGHLSLDFVNTLDQRKGAPLELITDYNRLISWTRQAGSLPSETTKLLEAKALRDPTDAARVVDEVRLAREVVFSLIRTVSRSEPMEPSSLAKLNALTVSADRARTLGTGKHGLCWMYAELDDLRAPLWPIIHATVELLLSEQQRRRIKLCQGETCDWAFLDMSRQGNRRWCDMSVCGNRAKVRRHRDKSQK